MVIVVSQDGPDTVGSIQQRENGLQRLKCFGSIIDHVSGDDDQIRFLINRVPERILKVFQVRHAGVEIRQVEDLKSVKFGRQVRKPTFQMPQVPAKRGDPARPDQQGQAAPPDTFDCSPELRMAENDFFEIALFEVPGEIKLADDLLFHAIHCSKPPTGHRSPHREHSGLCAEVK